MTEIIEKGPEQFQKVCSRCSTRFAYKISDLWRSNVVSGEVVSCPGCGESCRHQTWMSRRSCT